MTDSVTQIITGRIVSGNPSILTGVTHTVTKQPVLNTDGTQKLHYWTTIAVDKNSPELTKFFETVLAVAQRPWPSDLNSKDESKLFAWKIKDGDGLRADGKPYVDYCRNCWLITVRSGWVPSLVEPDGNGGWCQIIDPDRIQVGYHVRIGLKVAHNGDVRNSGLFMNPEYIALIKLDTVLSPGGVSMAEVSQGLGHSGAAIAHPRYSSPAGVPTPGVPTPGVPTPGSHVPAEPTPGSHVPAGPTPGSHVPAGPTPGSHVPAGPTPGSHVPAGPTPGVPTPSGPTPSGPTPEVEQFTMTFKAQGSTREQFLSSGNGWTDELLIQHGYMNAPTHPGILTH